MALDKESFEKFLSWLSLDREEAGVKYLELRKKLIRFFSWGGCHEPDELFDDTVNRASNKIASGAVERSVSPIAFCDGVARNVLREYRRRRKLDSLPEDPPASPTVPNWDEKTMACMDECLDRLSEHDRDLVRRYVQDERSEKIKAHKQMAAEEGGPNALRIKIFRIKNVLRDCVSECVKHGGEGPQYSGWT